MFPSFGQACLLVLGLVVIGQTLGGVLFVVVQALRLPIPFWLVAAPVAFISFGFMTAIGAQGARLSLREVAQLRAVPWTIWPPLVIAVLGLSIVMSEVDNGLRSLLPMPDWLMETFARLVGEDRLGGLFMLSVVAPVTEEVLFRGIILRGFLTRYPVGSALVLSSVLFGVAHANPWQLVSALGFGVLLGWLYYRGRSLWPSLVAHALVNGWPQVLGPLLPTIPGFNTAPTGPIQFQPWWFDLLGIGLLAVGVWLLRVAFKPLRIAVPGSARGTD